MTTMSSPSVGSGKRFRDFSERFQDIRDVLDGKKQAPTFISYRFAEMRFIPEIKGLAALQTHLSLGKSNRVCHRGVYLD